MGDVNCKRCGRPLRTETEEYCQDCKERKHRYDRGVSLYIYGDTVRKSIARFKYHNRREYADSFAEEICRHLGRELRSFEADALIPVPVSRRKRRKRGFNQAELLADGIGKHLGLPVYRDLVRRIRDTVPQKDLNRSERQKNLKRAFKMAENVVKLQSVIIVDDIYTTGSTIDEMAAVLKSGGVRRVYFVTLATGSSV